MRAETIKPLPSTLPCLPGSLRCTRCSHCLSPGWAGGKRLSPTSASRRSLATDQCEGHQHRWVLLVPGDDTWQGKARVFQQSQNSTMPSADAAALWLLDAFSAPDSTPKDYGSKEAGQEQARALGLRSRRQSTDTKSAGVVAPSEALLQLPLPGEGDQTSPRSRAVPVAASMGGDIQSHPGCWQSQCRGKDGTVPRARPPQAPQELAGRCGPPASCSMKTAAASRKHPAPLN